MDALARGELAGFVLALAALGSSTRFGFRIQTAKFFHAIAGFGLGNQAALGLRQRVLPGTERWLKVLWY